MKKFIDTLQNIWKIEELRNKILLTLGLLFIYRVGSNVPLPGVDINSLSQLQDQTGSGLMGLLNAFTGGAFANASVLALGIMPYISASIVIQLLGLAVPSIQKLQKDGESGRQKITQMTRYLTIAICLVQAPSYVTNLMAQGVGYVISDQMFWFLSITTLVAGTIFAMWLGERITDRGIGNGISILIMVGIIASFPMSILQEFTSRLEGGAGGLITIVLELAAFYLVVMFAIGLTQAVRRVPLQYAARNAASGQAGRPLGRDYLPLRVNASGVMPIIFAQAIMFIPVTVAQFAQTEGDSWVITYFSDFTGFWYNLVFAILIIGFTYFYTAIQVNTNNIADDLKRNGGFVPGVKPGRATAEYLDEILSRITLPGAILLALLAILPAFAMQLNMTTQWAQFYGGTSLLIIVGVILDTLMQIESYLLNRHYDGLMKSGRLKGRSTANVM
ncbi:MAG: preprotein translocase subunit SecY [Flavobacteriia bacterium]|nr:preprotein translocase subunit SecY [Flavobacteriia bacterium]